MIHAPMLLGLAPGFWLIAIILVLLLVFLYVACWEAPRQEVRRREFEQWIRDQPAGTDFDKIEWPWPSR